MKLLYINKHSRKTFAVLQKPQKFSPLNLSTFMIYIFKFHSVIALCLTVVLGNDYEMWMSTTLPINEELLQYRATENYTKKDSHQVDLTEGQTVPVIERFDTGKEFV